MGRVLVTGGSGFIGSHLVEHLLSHGDEVRALLRDAGCRGWLKTDTVEVVIGDVTDRSALQRAIHGMDVVYHVAGRTLSLSEEGFNRVNELGTANIAAACACRTSPPVLVAVSSLAAAGPAMAGRPRVESDQPAPVSAYGRSKLRGEEALRKYAREMPITIIRPPAVFGPRERYFLPMFRMVSRGWYVTVGTGALEISLVEVGDLVAGLRLAADRGRRLPEAQDNAFSGVYFLAHPDRTTFNQLAALVASALDRPAPRALHVPVPIVWGIAAAAELVARVRRRPGFVGFDKLREARAGCWTCSPERAERELGARPRFELPEALRQTANWYREQGWIRGAATAL
jgi:nucleoside-diphosphate-sugar epimerase